MPTPLLIDTDTGIDDAVAIALAARLETLDVVTVTTVHGNVEVERATRNAREVARRVGLAAPVVAGAADPLARPPQPARETHGEEGLGWVRPSAVATVEPDRAPVAIAAAARAHPGLTLCCLGPLTNLAHALAREPALGRSLGPVFIMGGALAVRGTQTMWSEFNWWSDPEAARLVLDAGLDIRLVPLDVTRRVAVPGSAIAAFQHAGDADDDARFWADALRFYADFHRSYESFDGCVINDALAVALAADSSLADWRERRLVVSCTDDARRGAVSVADHGATVLVAEDVRAREVLELVRAHVFGRWLPSGALDAGADAAVRWLEHNPLPVEAT